SDGTDRQHRVDAGLLVDLHSDWTLAELAEALQLGNDLVAARRQAGNVELPTFVADRVTTRSGAEIPDDDRHAGQHRPGAVLHDADDFSSAGLSQSQRGQKDHGQPDSEKSRRS